MNRVVIGALGALLLASAGVFWWQGHAASDNAPSPRLALPAAALPSSAGDDVPETDADGAVGPDLPEVSDETREEKRFDRLDRNHDGRVSRAEMLAARVRAFKKLDVDGNNLLTFDEWAVKSENKFKDADKNGDGWLTREEFATTRGKPRKPACKCK